MSELGIPGASSVSGPTIMDVARDRENIVVGDELVRHKLSSRVIHWVVALFFLGALFTGMPIWSPVFGWMAPLFGGLTVCRWLHAWSGVAFSAAMLVMFFHWMGEMRMEESDRKFRLFEYLKFSGAEDPNVGKYNAGQKMFFWSAFIGMLLVLLTGIPLWWPTAFGGGLRQVCILLHDVGYIFWFVAIVAHIYLGTAAEPGTFRSMTRGTVTRAWARLHHPRWFRDVTGERR
jgi:formate dehydrogenase subunit gamma